MMQATPALPPALAPTGYVGFERFAALRARAHGDQQAALAEVAEEFEAMFVDLMLRAAREAGMGETLFDSSELDTYREMLDQQLALAMARHHDLGIGKLLMRQLDGAGGAPVQPSSGGLHLERDRAAGGPAPSGEQGGADAFVAELAPHAERAAAALGVSARGLLAQAALETGWGRHVIRRADGTSTFNFFGIKAGPEWQGDTVEVPTTEYVDGRARTVLAGFRAYPDAGAAFDDYVALLQGEPRYARVRASADDAGRFARALAEAGYATDPRYAEKLLAVLERGTRSGLWPARE